MVSVAAFRSRIVGNSLARARHVSNRRGTRAFDVDLTKARVRSCGIILLVIELIGISFFIAGTHGWITKLEHPVSSDFVSYYAAGTLAIGDTPASVYDQAAHYAVEQQATEPGIGYNFFFYPPVYLLLCAPLARLPYLAAFVLFQAACLLPCLLLVRRILPDEPLVVLLAFPAVFWTIGTGQNALLTAALLAAATLTIDRRPALAGILFGALCYKPHFGLLVPIALTAGGHWRSFAAATGSLSVLVFASILAFHWDTWLAFLSAVEGADAVYATTQAIDIHGLTSPFGLMLGLGAPSVSALGLQGAAALCVALMVTWVWQRQAPLEVRAAVLLAGIPVAVPIVMFYDLMITGVALAWLVRAGRKYGFPAWQQTGLAVLYLLPLFSGNTGVQVLFPPAAVAGLGFVLALRQAAPHLRNQPRRSALCGPLISQPGTTR
jgi:alpha-1,2-mannosyltransferase